MLARIPASYVKCSTFSTCMESFFNTRRKVNVNRLHARPRVVEFQCPTGPRHKTPAGYEGDLSHETASAFDDSDVDHDWLPLAWRGLSPGMRAGRFALLRQHHGRRLLATRHHYHQLADDDLGSRRQLAHDSWARNLLADHEPVRFRRQPSHRPSRACPLHQECGHSRWTLRFREAGKRGRYLAA